MTYAVEDSYNGVRSAVAAGLKTIMIPDVQPPKKEFDDVIYKRFDSLYGFRDYLVIRELMERLWEIYPYASILWENKTGKRYAVSAQGMKAVQDAQARLVWYPEDFREDALETVLAQLPGGVWLQLPTVCEQATLEMLQAFVTRHADKLGGVVLGSVGQLGMKWPLPYGAGVGVPVMNRRAAQTLFEEGCVFVTASPELTGAELNTLMRSGAPIIVPAYGRVQLMLLHHCPARTALGLQAGHAACRMCDEGAAGCLAGTSLTDRKGYRFPLLRQRLPEGCLVRLMNTLPTDNMVRCAQWARMVELTDEDADIASMAAGALHGGAIDCESTGGHWNRPVE